MWFDSHIGNLLGGLLGGSLGVCGGIWGAMAGIFARKGKHKKFISAFAVLLISLGAISFCTGLVALIFQQPYHVWYPFTLVGFVLTACTLPNYFNIKKIYTKAELNKMSADDLG